MPRVSNVNVNDCGGGESGRRCARQQRHSSGTRPCSDEPNAAGAAAPSDPTNALALEVDGEGGEAGRAVVVALWKVREREREGGREGEERALTGLA